jgi:mono/diheme cytochrome c family protein
MNGMRGLIFATSGVFLVGLAFSPVVRADGAGEAIYKAKCTPCHAADGSGNNVMGKKLNIRDLRSPEVQKMSDADLTGIISKGKDKMPAYEKTLKPADIAGLVGYIRSIAAK